MREREWEGGEAARGDPSICRPGGGEARGWEKRGT